MCVLRPFPLSLSPTSTFANTPLQWSLFIEPFSSDINSPQLSLPLPARKEMCMPVCAFVCVLMFYWPLGAARLLLLATGFCVYSILCRVEKARCEPKSDPLTGLCLFLFVSVLSVRGLPRLPLNSTWFYNTYDVSLSENEHYFLF